MIWESVVLIIKNVGDTLLGWIPKVIDLFKNKDIPCKTIVIVNDDSGYRNIWSLSLQSGKPVLLVHCSLMVTNVTDRPVSLAKPILKGIKGNQEFADLSVKHFKSNFYGSYDISPRARTSVSLNFIISSAKIPKSGEAIKLKVGIMDQFGNKHWVKNVVFRSA